MKTPLASPPIKLKICLGTKKTSTSSDSGSKLGSSTRDLTSKDTSDRKRGRAIFDASNDRKKSSDRKKTSKHKSTSVPAGHALKNLHEKVDIETTIEDNDSNQENLDSDTDYDEEEKWLNAVESGDHGKLEKIDSELKNIKDPKLMTARQRAMLSGIGGR